MWDDFKYISLGATLNICSALSGGYFLENIKVLRQINPTIKYNNLVYKQYSTLGYRCWLNGFIPWGISQALTKGIPVIFVNKTSEKKLQPYIDNNYIRFGISGCLSGIVQSVCVTPTQRLKTVVWNEKINVWNALQKETYYTLYRGLTPMACRRGIDLSLRSSIINSNIEIKTLLEKCQLGIFATIFSCLISQPFDTIVARRQSKYKDTYSFYKHIINIYKKNGIPGFYRGLSLRLIDASQHTLWIFIVSNIILSRTY